MLILKITLILQLFIWLIAMIMSYKYGRIGRIILHKEHVRPTERPSLVELPPLSIVIPAHNQAVELRRHLPSILEQEYDRFEVIVIDMASTDETRDILERLELQHANLHHTFTPASARDISLERLALTLGIRSATFDWIVFTRPNCEPASPYWLARIGETIVKPDKEMQSKQLDKPDMVIGIARYELSRNNWLEHKMSFMKLWNTIFNIHHILDGHAAIGAEHRNLAFRKAYFFENGGFADSQDLKTGAEELLVNHTSKASNTAILLSPSAQILEEPVDSKRLWKQQRVFNIETQSHKKHMSIYRFQQFLFMCIPWLMIALLIMPLPFAISGMISDVYLYLFSAVTLVLVISYMVTKIICFNITAQALGYRKIYLSLFLLELKVPLWLLESKIAHRRTSSNEFRKKFV